MASPLYGLFRWLIFKVGDTRWTGWEYFPFVVEWDAYRAKIDQYEVHEAMKIIRPGDVIVLRHNGFLSNIGIGGAMIHAAICIGDDEVVEALSDDEGGVCRRHVADTLHADMAMILRPAIDAFAIADAIGAAKSIVGYKYDVLFDFSSETERDYIRKNPDLAKAGGVKFCCTEVPHFCYLDSLEKLNLYRIRQCSFFQKILSWVGLHTGNQIVNADMYCEANFSLVWASKLCTPETFYKMGCSEKFIYRVKAYWEKLKNSVARG